MAQFHSSKSTKGLLLSLIRQSRWVSRFMDATPLINFYFGRFTSSQYGRYTDCLFYKESLQPTIPGFDLFCMYISVYRYRLIHRHLQKQETIRLTIFEIG